MFERDTQSQCDELVVAICWIGFSVTPDLLETCPGLKEKLEPFINASCQRNFQQYELTIDGEPIHINEYATWISMADNTHVIHFDDKF